MDIPLSIQAVSGEELAKTGAVNFADYSRTIAGVSFLDSGPGRAQIFIRGVSTGGDVDTGKESTVGVYIDETPVTEGSSRSEEHTSELQSLMRISYAVFCLKKKTTYYKYTVMHNVLTTTVPSIS